jgi:hypothetical protein
LSVKELVASQDLDAYNAEGEPSTEAFLDALDAARSKKQRIGAAWRWAVAIADGGRSLELQLQSLPAGAAAITAEPLLRMDNAAVMVLARYPALASLFNGDGCGGPVPIMLSENPEESLSWLKDDVDAVRAGKEYLKMF